MKQSILFLILGMSLGITGMIVNIQSKHSIDTCDVANKTVQDITISLDKMTNKATDAILLTKEQVIIIERQNILLDQMMGIP